MTEDQLGTRLHRSLLTATHRNMPVMPAPPVAGVTMDAASNGAQSNVIELQAVGSGIGIGKDRGTRANLSPLVEHAARYSRHSCGQIR